MCSLENRSYSIESTGIFMGTILRRIRALALRYTRSLKLTEWNLQGTRATSVARADQLTAPQSPQHAIRVRLDRPLRQSVQAQVPQATGRPPIQGKRDTADLLILFAHARPKCARPFVPDARLQDHQSASTGRKILHLRSSSETRPPRLESNCRELKQLQINPCNVPTSIMSDHFVHQHCRRSGHNEKSRFA